MTRFALKVEYDGRGFVGWQRQSNGLSVQQVLERSAAKLCGGIIPTSIAAGRTDSGVHALGQVVQIDLPDGLTTRAVRDALNFHLLPHLVAVVAVGVVTDREWSARFSAIRRDYQYVILNRPARPAMAAGFAWHVRSPLDADSMQRAALGLVGRHDFTSFRATACQATSPVRTIDRLEIDRSAQQIIIFVSARSFLHHQVRNIVGSLKLVGSGQWPESKIAEVLMARDRAAAGPTAPAGGLTLMAVHYPLDPFGVQK